MIPAAARDVFQLEQCRSAVIWSLVIRSFEGIVSPSSLATGGAAGAAPEPVYMEKELS
jgi:hypothetical protein